MQGIKILRQNENEEYFRISKLKDDKNNKARSSYRMPEPPQAGFRSPAFFSGSTLVSSYVYFSKYSSLKPRFITSVCSGI